MLLFLKQIEETQISIPPKATRDPNFRPFHFDTPCRSRILNSTTFKKVGQLQLHTQTKYYNCANTLMNQELHSPQIVLKLIY